MKRALAFYAPRASGKEWVCGVGRESGRSLRRKVWRGSPVQCVAGESGGMYSGWPIHWPGSSAPVVGNRVYCLEAICYTRSIEESSDYE